MRITVLTMGSRGDVQPYLALAQGLLAAGHDVKLVTASNFRPLAESLNIPFVPVSANVVELMQNEMGLQAMESRNPIGFLSKMFEQVEPVMQSMTQEILAGCEDADLVVVSSLVLFVAQAIYDARGIPFVAAYPQPLLPTRDFQSIAAPPAPAWLPFKSMYNWWSHYLGLQVLYQILRKPANRVRKAVFNLPPMPLITSLAPIYRGDQHVLYGYSRHVIPASHDLPSNVHLTGYWFVKSPAWQPPDDLVRFLDAGSAPIYIGFGSMTDRDPEMLTTMIIEALRTTGQRAVLLSGWSGIGQMTLPDNIHVTDSTSHEWLLPRMAAAIHHGGAGTTAASLRAGIPTVIVPFIADQPFFGERVHKLGVGPRPIPRKELTAAALANAIHTAVHDQQIWDNAALLGDRIRAEDGVGEAVRVIEQYGTALRKHA
ncbi:MAG: glycosyltransferase family 1 protein [Anaerolineae bacterium]|nr:glycosyltransferase family 1 protein [Anaerolineae bacterium]